MRKNTILMLFSISLLSAVFFGSCVHEWPEPPSTRPVTIMISHETQWETYEFLVSRGLTRGEDSDIRTRYIYEIYPAGTKAVPVASGVFYRNMSLEDFEVSLDVPVGEFDIWFWNDYAGVDGASLFYNASDFGCISYISPYRGADELKDAFRGVVTVNVGESLNIDDDIRASVTLKRPLTSYVFVATDIEAFVSNEMTRRGLPGLKSETDGALSVRRLLPDFDRYTVKVRYTGFLPCVYDNYINKPVDSSTGVAFMTPVAPFSDAEVMCGYDFVFINGSESTLRVAIDVYDPKGELVSSTSSYDLPVRRNRCTIVRGEFLTAKATGGVGIDPSFDGEFNLEIR